ncbi:ATP-binding protein [Pseudodesulfovibrio sp. zrk46]|uniref:PAS domain-containing sensor histidine kinase n=1 Tax=Pseudodesulfovibrio sp. zrk46 TaxID=2725288 RepID=UPI0014495E47|nr:ATP-binding protein [Pseudodesulfovibrio sp. zrk46]QJB57185.1 GHKL domain-containing protein [Pseudodesulfovibrio sp. zrk46]
MRINTKVIILLTGFAILLLSVTGVVYHRTYNAFQDQLFEDGEFWGKHIQGMIQSNISFYQEDLGLFIATLQSDAQIHTGAWWQQVDNPMLSSRFIDFFENNFGQRFYEEVFLANKDGKILASTESEKQDCCKEDWWSTTLETGRSMDFFKDSRGRSMLRISMRIDNPSSDPVVLTAICHSSSLIRKIGHTLDEYHINKLELLTDHWETLYSTSLYKPFSINTFLKNKFSNKNINGVFQDKINGNNEIIVVQTHLANTNIPIKWHIVLSLDYNRLLKPVLAIRWWILGGSASLILLAMILFYLIRNIQTKHYDELQLIKNQKVLESILDGIEAGVLFIDMERFIITRASNVAGKILRVSPSELTGKPCYEYICRYGDQFPKKGCPAIGKKLLNAEFELKRKDETSVPISKTVLELEINDKPHFVAVIFDISERKNIERQLAHALKLESIGSLAAGIAHEINTPAQYITDNLRFIQKAFETCIACWAQKANPEAHPSLSFEDIDFYNEEVPQALEQSLEGVESITTTVQALKKLSHPGLDLFEWNNLNAILQNLSIVSKNEWKYTADLNLDLMEGLPQVRCNSHDISQAFLNLIINAVHAVKDRFKDTTEKGTISISTSEDGDNVTISIEDNGIGIPKEIQERIFDPFFTTKDVGQGSGQGLSICYSIITKHNGTIEVTSDLNVGTRFTIVLPINPDERD